MHRYDGDIVITGISGRLPESSNIEEFKENLMKEMDMITDDERRWPASNYGVPCRFGKIKNLSSFDASFFRINSKEAHIMDPQLRIMLEVTYETLIDAGVNPFTLRGSRTGVFIGAASSDANDFWKKKPNGYGLLGCCRSMFANRISFAFDFIGPSYAIETACSSSLHALHDAVIAIRAGDCDSAIVGGLHIILNPIYTVHLQKLQLLSQDGKCKSFDMAANGFARAEAVVAIYVQKAPDARRLYATIIGTKVNTDGYKSEGIIHPNGEMQYQMVRELYSKVGIDPADVVYVEAHATGTAIGDSQELNSVDKFFCKDRKTPLLIGSVKSNMGHAEPVSGLCSLAKMLIAMETGVIPANLHFVTPSPKIPGISEGRFRVVNKATPWNGGLIGINAFGFGGTNSHVILRSNQKLKLSPMLKTIESLPKLIAVSGCTEEAVHILLDKANEHQEDDEFLSLLHVIHSNDIPEHRIRGYEILNSNGTREVNEMTNGDKKRPIWFVFSGTDTQWPGMGRELFRIEKCQRSLRRCADALTSHGIDLINIIMNSTDETYENVVNSFVAIVAIQIALVDMLTSIGIYPDGIVGHSIGELCCGYADGVLTLEQTILAAYYISKSLIDSELNSGGMAAIGLSWEEIKKMCLSDISLACHNSADIVTVSGPIKSLEKFIKELNNKDIFIKMINSFGFAFHSKYIAPAEPKFRASLDQIIPNPKQRSAKWISTSVAEAAWNSPLAQFSSSEYYTNNLLSPVLFQEAMAHIPKNAITIEIAPHCLLQAILRTSLPLTVINISLHKQYHPNNIAFLLSNLGKLYMAGTQPDISKLYTPVSFPVGRGTPMIGPLVKWDHSVTWKVPNFRKMSKSEEYVVKMDLSKETDAYLMEHKIDGLVIFPVSGYILMVWKTFAKLHGIDYELLPVVFENVQFQRATILLKKRAVRFSINILDGTGNFEICEAGAIVVRGNIRACKTIKNHQVELPSPLTSSIDKDALPLNTEDVYKELKRRGYEHGNIFRGIKSCNNYATVGELWWSNKWIPYIDAILLFNVLTSSRELKYISRIQYVAIDPVLHKRLVEGLSEGKGLSVHHYENVNIIKSGGIEFRNIKMDIVPLRQQTQAKPKYERYTFVPYENLYTEMEDPTKGKVHALTVLLQIMRENVTTFKVKTVEFAGERAAETLLTPFILDILCGEPLLTVDLQVAAIFPDNYTASFTKMNLNVDIVTMDSNNTFPAQDVHLAVAADVLSKQSYTVLKNLAATLKPGCFILLEETAAQLDLKTALKDADLTLAGKQTDSAGKIYLLLKKQKKEKEREPIVIQITEKNFSWLESMKIALKKSKVEGQEVLLVSQGEELIGLVGFMTCIRRETTNARYIFIQDKNAPEFNLSSQFYAEQLDKGLMANVLKGGKWGSYRHLQLDQQSNVQVEHAYVNALTKGDLSSLRWIQNPLNYYQSDRLPNILCSVYYAALNFRDIMLVSGKLSLDIMTEKMTTEDCPLGFEFSGRDPSGNRVMGIVETGGLATTVLADSDFLWEVPDQWTLEQAATIPIVYATSYYALFVQGQLKVGESVLIHAGTGSIGLAAITIALHAGCTVFTTVGTLENREYLKKVFPQLTDRYIGSFLDTSFEQLILIETQGRGVDVVLNSLAEEKLQASIRCLATNGRFLEIEKYDSLNNDYIDISMLLKNTFKYVSIEMLFKNCAIKTEVIRLVSEGIKNGAVRPLISTVFTEQQLEEGFRFMADDKHIGKVLLKIRNEEPQKCVPSTPKIVTAVPRTYMNPKKSYVVICGLGGCGLEVANWMIIRGAKFIVLVSRSGIRTGYQALCVRRWRESGVTVIVSTTNVTTLSGIERLIGESNRLAPVGGIFNLMGILCDALIENLKEADFKAVMLKADITRNLNVVSRKSCPLLDYFVVFSSTVSGRGNLGQANYGLANSATERMMEQRYAEGLPGLAIQWGAIEDVDLRMDTLKDTDMIGDVGGTSPQRMSSCLATLDNFLQQNHPVLSSMIVADKGKSADDDVNLVKIIINMLGIKDVNLVNPDNSLDKLGADSLIYTAIKQILEREHNIMLSSKEIHALTITELQNLLSTSDKSVKEHISPTTEEQRSPATNAIITDTKSNVPLANSANISLLNKLLPKETIIRLRTKSERGPVLFIIYEFAIKNLTDMLECIAGELERPLWVLQNVRQAPDDTISNLAEFYVNIIRKIQKGPYHLVGYSFGACVAFEIAVQLESAGEKVVLNLLDSSPAYVQRRISTYLSEIDFTNKNIKDFSSRDYMKALAYFSIEFNKKVSSSQMYNILEESKSDMEMFDKILEVIRYASFSLDDLKTAGYFFFKKLMAAAIYNPDKKFKGPVTLITATNNFFYLKKDYDLSMICTQPVNIIEVQGDHKTILLGESAKRIANILQRAS